MKITTDKELLLDEVAPPPPLLLPLFVGFCWGTQLGILRPGPGGPAGNGWGACTPGWPGWAAPIGTIISLVNQGYHSFFG